MLKGSLGTVEKELGGREHLCNEGGDRVKNKKTRILIFVGGCIVLAVIFLVIGFFIGMYSNAAEIDGEIYAFNELLELRLEKAEEYDELVKKADKLEEDLESKKDAIDEALELYEERENINSELKEKRNKIKDLNSEITDKQDELALVTGELNKKGNEPILLSAGHYVVGSDLPPGRYIVEAKRGGGNFSSHNMDDRLNFSTTVGEGEHREKEYVFYAEEGDRLKLGTELRFTAVE